MHEFISEHPQWSRLDGYRKDRPTQPWVLFTAGELWVSIADRCGGVMPIIYGDRGRAGGVPADSQLNLRADEQVKGDRK
jgi:hypothetical protein